MNSYLQFLSRRRKILWYLLCSLTLERFREQAYLKLELLQQDFLLCTVELKTPLEKEWYAAGKTAKWRL